jgi:hypothetical protein
MSFFTCFLIVVCRARESDKRTTYETAINYHKHVQHARKIDIDLSLVSENEEPPQFASCFHGWRRPISTVCVSYVTHLSRLNRLIYIKNWKNTVEFTLLKN